MSEDVDLIRSRSDIVDLVSQRVILKRVGKRYSGLCPFHDDKRPSFSVDPTTGRYRCFSCQESGDVFTWVMKTENLDFAEAIQILAQRAGVELSRRLRPEEVQERETLAKAMREAQEYFRRQFRQSAIANKYCEGRGLTLAVVDQWELGFAPDHGEGLVSRLKQAGLPLQICKDLFLIDQDRSGGYFDKFRNRLMFPIFDERSQLVGFGGRILGDGQPKYMNSSDTKLYRKSKVLYGLKRARETLVTTRKAILVEGYLDLIACHTSGASGAVASLGTALAEDHAKLIKRYADEVTVLYDQDAAGQKASERAIGILEAEGVRVKIANLPPGDDPDTLLRREGPEAVVRAISAASSPTAFRLGKLEERSSPDRDEFWTEAIELLAKSSEDLEREGHLVRLAGLYPHIRDVHVALARLTKMVSAARAPRNRNQVAARGPATSEYAPLSEPLQAAETILFGALLEPKFQKFAWLAMQTPELLATGAAVRLAGSIREAFPETPPQGEPIEWIHRVDPEEMRRLLSDIALNFHLEKLTEQLVADSIVRLRGQAVQEDLRRLRQSNLTAEERQEVLRRVRILKPGSNAPGPAEDEDPFA